MRWKFAFGLASDDLFFVTTRPDRPVLPGVPVRSKITVFPDENEFLGHLMGAELRADQTKSLALAVLLSVAKPVSPPPWTEVDVSRRQMELLHLSDSALENEVPEDVQGKEMYLQAARSGALPQFYDLLMQAPTAVAMLVGPEHRYTFLNAKYVELVGAKSPASMLGKTMAEAFPEIYLERTGHLLDRVYETGQRYVTTENLRSFYRESSGRVEDGYFNSVYQPICNAFGEVSGVMVQSTDVTEMVLARDVREQRERQLYRQWAELGAIYRSAPIAMMLIDVKGLRIQRLNERQAELMGQSVAELLGRPLLETVWETAELRELLRRALAGESISNHIMECALTSSPTVLRCWMVSYAPTFSAEGEVEAIISVALEISRETRAEMELDTFREVAVRV